MEMVIDEGRTVFRPNEVRTRYGISRDQVFKLIANGELRSFTIGKARYIRAEAIEEYIRRREELTTVQA
jgi:excisionase family DNA binding protein